MQVSTTEWSKTEKEVAQEAFEKAYEREIEALKRTVREKVDEIAELDDVWRLHDIDGKYEYRDSVLIFVFARLVKEGWLHLDELDRLDADKLAKIAALARM
jgi:hypothetical protein